MDYEYTDLAVAIKRVGDINYSLAMAQRTASPQTLVEMLSDLEMAVQNAKSLAVQATTVEVE